MLFDFVITNLHISHWLSRTLTPQRDIAIDRSVPRRPRRVKQLRFASVLRQPLVAGASEEIQRNWNRDPRKVRYFTVQMHASFAITACIFPIFPSGVPRG